MKQSGTKSFILGNLFVVLLFLLSFTNAHAQWAYTYGGAGDDSAYAVQQTSDGGYVVAGATYSFGAGGNDAWIMKLDENGVVEWQKAYGGTGVEYPNYVLQTQDGGYIVSGYTSSFGTVGQDSWIMKIDKNGGVEWQKAYGGTGRDYTSPVQQTLDGGYIVVGWTYSFGNGGVDLWLFKLDENGDIVWQKTYGGTGNEYGWFVQQTSDGGYIVVGETTSSGAGNADAWVIKLDANGNVTWQKTYGGTGDDYAYAIQQTQDLGYIVAAQTNSFGAGSSDVWIFKLDANGSVTWQKTYGGTGSEYPWFVQQTSDLGYIVAAETNSFGAGQYDGWLLKLDANGNVAWQKTYGGSGNDYAWFAQQAYDGGYIVAGDSESFGQGGRDAWILKLDSSGSIGSCPFEGISAASVTDTAATVIDTSVTPITSTATTTNTTATVTDTTVSPNIVCSASLGLERLKVGSSNKNHGVGTVTSREGLITCPDSCQAEYTEGFNVTLSATPSALSTFMGWKPASFGCEGVDPCLLSMDKKKSVKAIFQGPNKLKVVTTFKNGGAGTVTSGDALINCPGDCEELYILNAPVTLTANEGVGSTFVKWTGKSCKDQQTNVCTFTMEKNATVKAIFAPTS
jgi:hypothetical protein